MFSHILQATLAALVLSLTLAFAGRAARQAPAVPFDVVEKGVPELQAAMEAGTVTARDLVEQYLARIEAYDGQGPELASILSLNPRARDLADILDRERRARGPRGPLHGIPILVKDNFDTVDMPTTGGSVALAAHQPSGDAFQVRRLQAAGTIILGKTNMHELAAGITTISSLGGQTRNPYDPSRNPGGSSGGTGAAVAASFAAFGLGSDTCGSIRIPSAHNNLAGLRGTPGLSSRDGIIPLSLTQDIGGPLARTVTDLAIALDATVGPDPADPATTADRARPDSSFRAALRADALKGARLGVVSALFEDGDPDVVDVARAAIEEMKGQGAQTVDVTIPELDELLRTSGVINYEFKFDLMDYLAKTPRPPVASLAEILDRGLYHAALDATFRRRSAVEMRDSEEYRKALSARRVLADRIVETLAREKIAALVYPTMRRRPAPVGEAQAGTNCQLSAHSGLPALAVQAGFTEEHLPVGIELLGAPWSDTTLVGLGYAFEQATRHRRPPLSTPPLVDDAAPVPVSVEIDGQAALVVPPAGATPARLAATLTFDAVRGWLGFQAGVGGVAAADVMALTLHRGEAGANGPVLRRLLEPGAITGQGLLELTPRERTDLAAGRLYVQLYTRGRPGGALRAQLRLP